MRPHTDVGDQQARRPGYPTVKYHGTDVPVLVGDHVEFKLGLFFWRGWQAGRVQYVPGISPKNDDLEFNGLTWVAIHDARGAQSGHVVLPDTAKLRKNVRFVRRADDGFTKTPANYFFGDEATGDVSERSARQREG